MSKLPPAPNVAIIAEDEDLGRMLLGQSAAAAGLTPLLFDNGQLALDAALACEAAIILLDVDMPGLDGYSVCRRLRKSGRLGSVPIVMVTGHDDAAAINQAFEAGATDYISKPVNWALLPHRLAYILRNAAAVRALADREAKVRALAYFDSLTGLSNRQHCVEMAAGLIEEAEATRAEVAFVYIDLNSFKRINDTFGHSVGDGVLKNVAEILHHALVPFITVDTSVSLSRFGADEFVILVKSTRARGLGVDIANMCSVSLKAPVLWNHLEFFMTPSIGIAVYPDDGSDVDTLLKHADTAMYDAKSNGVTTVSVYTAAMSARLRDWLELESMLRRAVREDSLSLHYQPKFCLRDQKLAGVEALVRWFDPEFGEISPTRFIPIAEETGLIVDMGNWIIRAACQQLRNWLDRGIALPIAINISGKDILYGDPAGAIQREIQRLAIPGSLIEIELTESVFVTDTVAGRTTVDRLRNLGCKIALDDFGTGYSSLSYLTRFPPDRIKIDRSFIRNVDCVDTDAAIVNSIMSLAKSLGLTVTAEGVERQSQADWLRARGCHEAQGYLLARPMTALALETRFLTPAQVDGVLKFDAGA